MNILFISLGCDKNLVDSEVMLGLLAAKGYRMVDDEMQADIIIVNTCPAVSSMTPRKRASRRFWRWHSTRRMEGLRCWL